LRFVPPVVVRQCLLAVFLPGAAFCLEGIPSPPPVAKSDKVSVVAGSSAEIPLKIGGRVVEPVRFLIRKFPKSGSLSEPRRTGKNSAVVTYTPNAGNAGGQDTFSFAAQSSDSPVSASATVTLELVPAPAKLEFDTTLDFGTVFLGEPARRGLAISNAGGGAATGKLVVTSPWKLGGQAPFYIPPGREHMALLTFDPREERDYSQSLQVGPNPRDSVLLRGKAMAPLAWRKEGIIFSPGQRRSGKSEIEIANRTPAARQISFAWPDFISAPSTVEVPAAETFVLPVEIVGGPDLNFEGNVTLQSGAFSASIPLRVFPGPPQLSTSPSAQLVLGEIEEGKSLSGQLRVRNSGGVDAALYISVPEGFTISPNPSSLVLPHGKEMAFVIGSDTASAFRAKNGRVRLEAPGADSVELEIVRNAQQKIAPSLPVENYLSIKKDPLESASPDPSQAFSGPPPNQAVQVRLSEPHLIELEWKIPSQETVGFRIERQHISVGSDGSPVVSWRPWPDVVCRVEGGMAFARWSRLPANSFWTIRIIALDAAGQPGPPSPAFRISTPLAPQASIPPWVWLVLIAAVAAAAGRLWVIRRRQVLAQEDARLARLQAE